MAEAVRAAIPAIQRFQAWTRRLIGADGKVTPSPPPSIATRRIDPKRIGRGFIDERAAGKARIVVTVETETLALVRDRAIARGVPVAVIIREFVELGLSTKGVAS